MALRQLICMRNIPIRCGITSSRSQTIVLYRQLISQNVKYLRKQEFRTTLTTRTNTNKKFFSNPFEGIAIESGPIQSSKIWKSFVFTVAFSTGSFLAVSVWEYEILRLKASKGAKNLVPFSWFKSKLHNSHRQVKAWRRDIDSWWSALTPGEQIFAPICALNVLVFGLWRVPRFQPMMVKYFCSNPVAKAVCWPMVLSTFSHYSLFHIFANMYVLHSFSHAAVASLGKEQFLGLYLSAGIVSGFSSYLYKAVTGRVGLSLGASGAIMGILAYVCTQYPNTQLSIIFLPMLQFSAGTAIKFIIGLDVAGAVLGWRIFDHAAHLGGAVFGLFWCYIGSHYLWPKREYFLKQYHQFRTSLK